MGAAVGAVAGGGGGWPRVGWWGFRRPRPHWLRRRPRRWPQPRSRQWHHWWPCCQSCCRHFYSCVCVFFSIFRVMRLHEPLGPPYTKKSDFFNERIFINGRRGLSKHAPRHLPPAFVFQSRSFSPRAGQILSIWEVLVFKSRELPCSLTFHVSLKYIFPTKTQGP